MPHERTIPQRKGLIYMGQAERQSSPECLKDQACDMTMIAALTPDGIGFPGRAGIERRR